MWEGTYMWIVFSSKPSLCGATAMSYEAIEGASKTLKKLSVIQRWHRLLCSRELFLREPTIGGMLSIDLLHPNGTPPGPQILVLLLHFPSGAAQYSLRKDVV
jgi:hypothetical protein